jgi:phosphonate metabolism protein PhnN/1,5-bisphosphokinase (PRPP-forming)
VFVGVVGASGAGKDTVLSGAHVALQERAGIIFARRTITRPADAGGEDHYAVSVAGFGQLKAQGAFALDWQAHGLCYGVPAAAVRHVAAGHIVVCNISRTAVRPAFSVFGKVEIIEITARPETVAMRLKGRGRETMAEIAGRTARTVDDWNPGLPVHTVSNDGDAQTAIDSFAAVLLSLSGQTARSA